MSTINADAAVQIWDRVRTSLWFVPALLVAIAFGLAAATPLIDGLLPDHWGTDSPLVFSGHAAGARTVLSTIATSTIGVAGVVFSMTIVSLQLASSQFGPRLLRTFLRDRGNQFVLGTFLGTFVYCIVVLPTIDGSGESVSVPHTAVSVAVLLSILSLAMLVYFIDHVAQSIHADAVMHSLGTELEDAINNLFPGNVGSGGRHADSASAEVPTHEPQCTITARASGYIRFINAERLLELAAEHDVFLRIRHEPGQFVSNDAPLADVVPRGDAPDEQDLDDEPRRQIRDAFVVGAHRTGLQDILFTFEQIAEMAMRAMSPGINDPTTAVHCIDRIGAGIARLVTREIPPGIREDDQGTPRLQIDTVGLAEILESTVVAISRTAGVHLQVWLRLIEILNTAAERASRPEDVELLRACEARFVSRGRSELSCNIDQAHLANAAHVRARLERVRE